MAPEDAEIAKKWPRAWAKAHDGRPGAAKRRGNLRRQYREALKYERFVKGHPFARCGNCANLSTYPLEPDRLVCDLRSDHHGYSSVSADSVCVSWRPRKGEAR